MADQLAPVLWRAVNSNGDPVASAEANWFEAGTSTPLTVYQDEALTTPHAAPQVADASGIFDQVFIAAGTAAKVTVTEPSAGSTLYTIDPVPLTSTGGVAASTITFTPITDNAATDVQTAIANENARIDTANTNIATNTSDIATNTSDIATNTAAIADLPWFISSQDASASATLDFTGFDATKFDAYRFVLSNVIPSVDGADLEMVMSDDTGSIFTGATYNFERATTIFAVSPTASRSGNSSGAAEITLCTNVGSDAGEDGVSISIDVFGPHLAKRTFISWAGAYDNGSGTGAGLIGSGVRRDTDAVDAVRFLFDSGNIESGTITMYGLRNS